MTETRTYLFEELPEEGKKKALEKYRDINTEGFDWYDSVFDYLASENGPFKGTGLEYVSCSFSGFWSQGDGASVEYRVIDRDKFITFLLEDQLETHKRTYKHLLALVGDSETLDCDSQTTYNGRHCYNYSEYDPVEFETYGVAYGQKTQHIDALIDCINEVSRSFHIELCRDVYYQLKKEYAYLISDDAIIETFTINEFLFTVNGVID